MQRQTSPHRTDQKRGKRVKVAPGIFQRELDSDGTRFQIFWNVDRREQSKVFHGSLTQAKAERERLRVKTREGEIVMRTKVTVKQVAEEFFESVAGKVARGERGSRTLESYRAQFANHIEPKIGNRPIQSITTADLARLIAELRAKEKHVNGKPTGTLLSAWTLHNVCKVLKLVFKSGVKHGHIATNPLARISEDLPAGKNETQARILDAEDVRKLIEATPESYRVLVATLAFTAMRISEALGLVWGDIDFDAAIINVSKQLSRATREQRARRMPLKTEAAARQIDIAPELLAMLRRRREEAFRQGYAKPEDYVFATQIGTPLSQRNTSARGLEKGAAGAGLNRDGLPRLGFHDLRHTAITHLIRSGADVAQVQRFAGHAKPSITLDLYVGVFEKRMVNDSGARLAAIYGGVQ
jgi:integrase